MFGVVCIAFGSAMTVYSVRSYEKDGETITEFLLYAKDFGWYWDFAENYRPIA